MLLADLIDEKAELISHASTYNSDTEPAQAPRVESDMVAKTMYSALILASNCVEMLSKSCQEYTNGYVIHKFPHRLNEEPNKSQLIEILKEIERENQELIQAYCSLETRLLLVLLNAASSSVTHVDRIQDVN